MHHTRGNCRHRRFYYYYYHYIYRNVTTTTGIGSSSSSDGLHTNHPSRRRPTHHQWYPLESSSSSLLSTETEPHRHPMVVTVQSSFDWSPSSLSSSSVSKPMCYTRGWAWQTVLLQERLRHKQLHQQQQVDDRRTEPSDHHQHEHGGDSILFMEHEPVYTLGRGADESHIQDLLRRRTPPQFPHDTTTTNNNTILLLQQQQQQEHIEQCRQRLSRTNHDRHNSSSRLIMESNTYRDFLGRVNMDDDPNDTTTLLQKVDWLCQHHVPKNPVRLPVPMMIHPDHDKSRKGTSHHETGRSPSIMIPIYRVERGGQVTYHGPGQLIMYPLWDLTFWKKDLRWFVHQMEQVVIDATRELLLTPEPDGVIVGRDATHTGVWVTTTTTTTNGHHRPKITTKKRKIAAIGISASRWITSHGICYNIHPNLQHYDAIVPCGIPSHHPTAVDTEHDDDDDESSPNKCEVEYGVTSLQELRQEQWSSSSSHPVSPAAAPLTMAHVASVVLKHLQRIFQIHRVQWGERIR